MKNPIHFGRMASSLGRGRSWALLAAVTAASAAALVNCSATEEEEVAPSEDAITGVFNTMGLAVRYDAPSGTMRATLNKDLQDGQRLYLRVRRGKLDLKQDPATKKWLTPSQQVDCGELSKARAIVGKGEPESAGKLVYQGPKVDPSIFDLVHLYESEDWATNSVPQALKDEVKTLGPTPIVEACILKNGKVQARLATNLAYAWDQNVRAEGQAKKLTQSIGIRAGHDGGVEPPPGINEETVNSQIEYGQLCVEQLGEIPFFKKLADGTYDTFDCRDLVGTNAEGTTGTVAPTCTGEGAAIPCVEGARIPAHVDGVEQENCSPGLELGLNSESYRCLEKADRGMFLDNGGTQPGPMVVTAKNAEGTHWILLCRKVSDDGRGMMQTKVFNDVAMLGTNPKTGRTCYFQNDIGTGRDGEHVPHPADVEKSSTMWSSAVQSYCSGSCHGESPFVHSPWIDGAKRLDGTPIIPKAGEHRDFPISDLSAPYNIIAGDKLEFKLPKQLVSDEVGACNNCHRLAGATLGRFAKWSTGGGDRYFDKITETGKQFANSHWMPPRLEGVTEATWETSKFAAALEFMDRCETTRSDPACIWADIPRGGFNNPAGSPGP